MRSRKGRDTEQLDKEQPSLLRTVESILHDREVIKKRHAEELLQNEKRLEPARRELAQLQAQCRRIIDDADAYLASTADPKIYQFQKELEGRRNSLWPETQSGTSIEGRAILTHSNHESVNAAVNRINEIICKDLKALALQPLNENELEAAIEDLRQSIPAITMKKVR